MNARLPTEVQAIDACFAAMLHNTVDEAAQARLRSIAFERHIKFLRTKIAEACITGWSVRTRAERLEQEARLAYYAKALAKVERRYLA